VVRRLGLWIENLACFQESGIAFLDDVGPAKGGMN